MPGFNPLRALANALQNTHLHSRQNADSTEPSPPRSPARSEQQNPQPANREQQVLDRAARGRFEAMANGNRSQPATLNKRAFKAALQRWVNEDGISREQRAQRNIAQRRMMACANSNLNNLRVLNLQQLSLTRLPPEIGQLRNIGILELDNNQLSQLPPEIGHLTNLRYLNLENNRLTSLPAEIGQLSTLHGLRLTSNQITHLPTELGRLRELRALELAHNSLTQLPEELANLSALQRIALNNNGLAQVDFATFPQNHGLLVDLRNNPIANTEALDSASSALFRERGILLSLIADTPRPNPSRLNALGPQALRAGVTDSFVDSLPTQAMTAASIKQVLRKLGHSDSHAIWSALEQRSAMGNIANDFTLLLARLYNRAPRENHQVASRTRQHIETVLTTLEQLHEQGRSQAIEEILHCAYDAVASCVDRASVHLLLMSAKSQYFQKGDEQALTDINTINATIRFIASLNKNNEQKQVFDNNSGSFKPFIETTDNNYQRVTILDEVEDILQLLNSGLLHTIDGCDMRHGYCATLTDQRHFNAAREAILALVEKP